MKINENLPNNVQIKEVYSAENKLMGYQAVVQVTQNDKITSPIFSSQQDLLD